MFRTNIYLLTRCSCHSRSPFHSSQGLSFAVHNQPYLILENYGLEDFSFLVCDGALLGNWYLTFCRNLAPLKMNVSYVFRMLGATYASNALSHTRIQESVIMPW